MIEIRKDPSPRELRWFGLLFLLFFAIVGGIIYGATRMLGVSTAIWSGAAAVTTALRITT